MKMSGVDSAVFPSVEVELTSQTYVPSEVSNKLDQPDDPAYGSVVGVYMYCNKQGGCRG